LVKLINAGIKVFVTTHSDYILKAKDLRAYIAHPNGTVSPVETDEYGMIQSGFDEAIVQTNEISNKIISAIDNLFWTSALPR